MADAKQNVAGDEKREPEKLYKVKVRVPDRSVAGHRGFYSAQLFFPNGDSEAIITEQQLAQLQAETSFLAVVEKSAAPSGAQATAFEAEPISAKAASSASAGDQPPPSAPTDTGPGKKLGK